MPNEDQDEKNKSRGFITFVIRPSSFVIGWAMTGNQRRMTNDE